MESHPEPQLSDAEVRLSAVVEEALSSGRSVMENDDVLKCNFSILTGKSAQCTQCVLFCYDRLYHFGKALGRIWTSHSQSVVRSINNMMDGSLDEDGENDDIQHSDKNHTKK